MDIVKLHHLLDISPYLLEVYKPKGDIIVYLGVKDAGMNEGLEEGLSEAICKGIPPRFDSLVFGGRSEDVSLVTRAGLASLLVEGGVDKRTS